MKRIALVLLAAVGIASVLFFTKMGLSRLTVRLTIQTNQTFSIAGIPVTDQKAQRLVLKGMTTVGITNAMMIASTLRDVQTAHQIHGTLTNAGFQHVGLRLTSRQPPP